MKYYNKKTDKIDYERLSHKEQEDKNLLSIGLLIKILVTVLLTSLITICSFLDMPDWLRIVLLVIGSIIFLAAWICLLRIEQTAGYFECANCGHRYVPTFKSLFLAFNRGRIRYMKCPKCGIMSWQHKIISKYR